MKFFFKRMNSYSFDKKESIDLNLKVEKPQIDLVQKYKTRDGQLFDDKISASKHDASLQLKQDLLKFVTGITGGDGGESNTCRCHNHNLVVDFVMKNWFDLKMLLDEVDLSNLELKN